MSNLTRVTEWTPFPQARQEEGKQGCSSPSGLFHSHVQRALLPVPQPPGGLGVSRQSPEGAERHCQSQLHAGRKIQTNLCRFKTHGRPLSW